MGKIKAAAIYALGILMFLWLVGIGLIEILVGFLVKLAIIFGTLAVILWKALLLVLTKTAIFALTILVGKK